MEYSKKAFEVYLDSIEEREEPCPSCGKETKKQFCSISCFEAYMR